MTLGGCSRPSYSEKFCERFRHQRGVVRLSAHLHLAVFPASNVVHGPGSLPTIHHGRCVNPDTVARFFFPRARSRCPWGVCVKTRTRRSKSMAEGRVSFTSHKLPTRAEFISDYTSRDQRLPAQGLRHMRVSFRLERFTRINQLLAGCNLARKDEFVSHVRFSTNVFRFRGLQLDFST